MRLGALGGWTRLWVVLSLTWAIFWAFAALGNYRGVTTPAEAEESAVRYNCNRYIGGEVVDLLATYSRSEILRASNDRRAADRPDVQKALDSCAQAMVADYQGQYEERRRRVLVESAWLAMLPPFVLLLAGLALSWVIRGFRK